MEVQPSPVRTSRSVSLDNPCGRSPVISDTEVYRSLDHELQLALAAANNLGRTCGEAKEAYVTEKLLTASQASRLDNIDYQLPGLPATDQDSTHLSSNNISIQLTKDFEGVEKFKVFLQHSKKQQKAHSGSTFEDELNGVHHALENVQCSIQNVLRSQGFAISSTLDSNIIPDSLKNLKKSKHRYQRDFLIIKQAKNFATLLAKQYDSVKKDLS